MAGEGARPTFHTNQCLALRLLSTAIAVDSLTSSKMTLRCLLLSVPELRAELSTAARTLVLDHCLREHSERIDLHAVVIMPDHVHLLFRPLRDEQGWAYPVIDVLQCLKGATAHRINKLLGISGPVWQEESFDHVLRNSESLKEKVEYIRQNPVQWGLWRSPRITAAFG